MDSIVQTFEAGAAEIVKLVAERDRIAIIRQKEEEVARQKWLAVEAERKRIEALKASIEELQQIVDAWTNRTRVEAFFEDAKECATTLSASEREAVIERIGQARALLNPLNPLERLLAWRLPEERLASNQRTVNRASVSGLPSGPTPLESATSAPAPRPYWETRHWPHRH